MFKRIMVVVDPARDMVPAQGYVTEMVERWDSSVIALYTAFEEAAPFKASYSEGRVSQKFVGKSAVKEYGKLIKKSIEGRVDFKGVVEEGPYEVTIPAVAARENADLVVLGSFHARMERVLVGSDTERVIEYSPCPVLLVRCACCLPKEGSLLAFVHDSLAISKQAVKTIAQLQREFKGVIQPVLGVPPRSIEEGEELAHELMALLVGEGTDVRQPQVLTSRWILGPHGVIHRTVSGMHPDMVIISRYPGITAEMASHWLVHEFVADTPCPILILK